MGGTKLKLSHVSIWVKDQDEALRWYTEKLGFEKRQDDASTIPGYRWLTVAPTGQNEPEIVLGKPDPQMMGETGAEEAARRIGNNPTWVLDTDDCRRAYKELSSRGVKFTSPPEEAPWGVSVIFVDFYGNSYNIVEPRRM